MIHFRLKRQENYNYWKEPKEGFPKRIYWRKIAGNRLLSILEESELIFDEKDIKIRQLNLKDL